MFPVQDSSNLSWTEQQMKLFDSNADGKIDLDEFKVHVTIDVLEER